MRAAILGAALDDRRMLHHLTHVSSRITHTDPKAEFGAIAVALAAKMGRESVSVESDQFIDELSSLLDGNGDELVSLIEDAAASVRGCQSTGSFGSAWPMASRAKSIISFL